MKTDLLEKLLPKNAKAKSGLLVFVGALGVFLLIAGGLPGGGREAEAAPAASAQSQYSAAYARQLEDTLTEFIGSIEGAGRTRVAVTLEGGAETVYALDETYGGDGGQREYKHILLGDGQGQSALVEMTWEPVIRGIAVVCEGAEDVGVNAQITQAVSVLTGVSTNRISISKMS